MRFLILGASGLVGSAMKRQLEAAGHEVTGTYCADNEKYNRNPTYRQLEAGDITGIDTLLEEELPDVVISAMRGEFDLQIGGQIIGGADQPTEVEWELKRVKAAKYYIEELFKNNADGHDAAHSLRVYHNAMAILDAEITGSETSAGGRIPCDKEVVALAALLHDVDDHKLFQTENNANARLFLTEQEVPAEKIEFICEIINGVSFSKNRGKRPATPEGKIVQDADRLDALGAIGIARTFAYGGKHGRSLDASVEHFYDKLLLLKDEMNTAAARKMAEERHAFLEAFLEEYRKES